MDDTKNSTIDNPIAFFRNLLFYDGIKDLLQQFENDAEVLGANYDEANTILWYYEVNDEGEHVRIVERFSHRFRKRLKEEVQKSKVLIDRGLTPTIRDEVNKTMITNLLDNLYSWYVKCSNDETIKYVNQIQESFISLIRHLSESYKFININHKALKFIPKKYDFRFSYFGAVLQIPDKLTTPYRFKLTTFTGLN